MKSKHKVGRRRLKYVATINDDALSEETDPNHEIQYVDIGNVDSLGAVKEIAVYDFADAPSRARRLVRDGDVIISCVRTYLQAIAAIHNPPKNLVVSTGFAVVRPRRDVLEPEFAKYAFREPSFLAEVERRSVGVSYPAINSSDLADIRIALPALAHQRLISRHLDREVTRLDDLIAAKERLIKLLAEKRGVLINRAVTRGLDDTKPRKNSGVSWLRKIPARWEIKRGKWLFRERDERSTTGNEVLLSLRMHRGLVPHNEVSDRLTRSEELIGYKKVAADEIVVNRMRAASGLIAVSPQEGLVSPDYAVFRCAPGVDPNYFTHLFKTDLLQAVFRSESTGLGTGKSGFLRLYSENFLALWFPYPCLVEQREIVVYINREASKLDNLSMATSESIFLLKERRASLIASSVTGQVLIQ